MKSANVILFSDASALLTELIRRASSKCNLLVLDLYGADAIHLLTFVKSSPQIYQVPVVTVATEEMYASIEPPILLGIEATLLHPIAATELSAAVAKIREQLDPDPEL